MILQALAAYYEKLAEMGKATRPGWCTAKVSYALNLTEKGEPEKERGAGEKDSRGCSSHNSSGDDNKIFRSLSKFPLR